MERLTSGPAGSSTDDHQHHGASSYSLAVGLGGLDFKPLQLSDPVPTGRQILKAAGISEASNWAILALLPDGDMEDVRLDETFDLRTRGVERFVAFETDRLYRVSLLERQLLWGSSSISAADLYELANIGEEQALFLDIPSGIDRPIDRDGSVDLAASGVERVIAGPRHPPLSFEIHVIFNGIQRSLRVQPSDTVAATIAALRPLFGNPGGDLTLVNAQGQVLAADATLQNQSVKKGDRLQLRPLVVQGG